LTIESFEWVENRPGGPRLASAFRELWRFRGLAVIFAVRDVKVRYKQAVFGGAWAVIQPIAGMLVLTVVFHKLGHVQSTGVPYVPSTLLTYSAWTYVSASVVAMSGTFLANAPLVTKVYFPRLTLPVGVALSGSVQLGAAFVVVVAFMIGYAVVPGIALLTLPLWIAALVATALGAGMLAGTLNVQFRDVSQLVGLLVQLWFFASPVAYQSGLVKGRLSWLFHVNPMAGILDGLRWAVLAGPAPTGPAVLSLAVAVALVVGAIGYFLHAERRFADII
jgi:ABC-type polysaccharide/polyol phosphate export permease